MSSPLFSVRSLYLQPDPKTTPPTLWELAPLSGEMGGGCSAKHARGQRLRGPVERLRWRSDYRQPDTAQHRAGVPRSVPRRSRFSISLLARSHLDLASGFWCLPIKEEDTSPSRRSAPTARSTSLITFRSACSVRPLLHVSSHGRATPRPQGLAWVYRIQHFNTGMRAYLRR